MTFKELIENEVQEGFAPKMYAGYKFELKNGMISMMKGKKVVDVKRYSSLTNTQMKAMIAKYEFKNKN